MINLTNNPNLDKWDDRLQSPVTSFNLSKPMTMIGFMSLPEHARKEYLTSLRRVHGGKLEQVAQMFGCSTKTVRKLYDDLGVGLRMGRFGAAQEAAWAKFIEGYKMPEMEAADERALLETPQNAPEAPKAEDVPEPPPALEEAEPPGTEPAVTFTADTPVMGALRAFRVDLAGPMDGVLAKLKTFTDLIGNMPVRVTISVDEEE